MIKASDNRKVNKYIRSRIITKSESTGKKGKSLMKQEKTVEDNVMSDDEERLQYQREKVEGENTRLCNKNKINKTYDFKYRKKILQFSMLSPLVM